MKYTFIFLSFAFILEKNINFLYYTKRLCIVKKAEFLYNNEDYTFQEGACKIMLLLLVIYIAFIGVGIPETLIGTTSPVVLFSMTERPTKSLISSRQCPIPIWISDTAQAVITLTRTRHLPKTANG